jgi:uncharacterized alkaline shock family protein YloU
MEGKKLGRVEVAPTTVARLASQAVVGCYGVVGMAQKDLGAGIAALLQPASHHRGVEVKLEDDQIVVDLYVIIEYGTRIVTVARNIQTSVKYSLEKALGIPVAAINVHVQGLRVSSGD